MMIYEVMNLASLRLFRQLVHTKDVLGAHAYGLNVGPHPAHLPAQIKPVVGPDHEKAVPGLRAEENWRWDITQHATSEPCLPHIAKEKMFDYAPHVGR